MSTLYGHKNTVTKVSWNDNGNWLLTASRDQLIKLYDIRAMKELCSLKGHHKEVTSVAWHPVYEVWYQNVLSFPIVLCILANCQLTSAVFIL